MNRFKTILALTVVLGCLAGCGGGTSSSGNNGGGGGNPPPPTTTTVDHVVVVVVENQNYSDVIGNSGMPFINALATQYSLATQFYANAHPSLGNYFMMTTGDIVNTDDAFAGSYGGDTVQHELSAAGKSWKVYAQSIPSPGYLGTDHFPYVKHHNPFAYFDEVRNDPTKAANIMDFSQFSADLNAGSLPSYSMVVPDDLHNGHDCPGGGSACTRQDRLVATDQFLSDTFTPLINNSTLMANTLLIVTFDESANDNTQGGGRI